MDFDRRNSRPRAAALRRILDRLIASSTESLSCDELAAAAGIAPAAAMRIVRQLAARMLVRNVAPGRWRPTTLLSRVPNLQRA